MSENTLKDYEFSRSFSYPAIQDGTNGTGLSLFKGRIQAYDYATQTYTVYGGNTLTSSCVNVCTLLSGLLGLKINTILEPGTPVLVLKDTTNFNTAYILGTMGTGFTNENLFSSNYIGTDPSNQVLQTLAKDSGKNEAIKGTADAAAIGLAPGETSIHNASGSALQLLHTLASLKASDLAKIECFVQDDMVRILSKTYQNINALGEYNIYNENGQLNVVWKGTNKEFESFDKSSSGTGIGNASGNIVTDVENGPEESFDEDGRWRFQTYIGQLGNFIHLFITDPKKVLNTSGDKCIPGRANLHVNEDGSVLVQSLSDIAFEKVVRIPVPVEKKRWEETSTGNAFDPEAMKNWTTRGDESLWQMSYKLADYSRWFSQTYCNSGFIGNKERFVKPDETNMDEASPFADDVERESVDGAFISDFDESQKAYATIRIFKDGSIVLADAYGSSVHLTGGYIQLSAAKDMNIHATGNLNISANDIAVTALNSFTATSVNGTAELAGKTMARVASTEGFTVLESTMTDMETVEQSKNESVKSLIKDSKINDKAIASVIINTNDKTYGNILLNANGLIAYAKTILLSSMQTIISCVKSFLVKDVFQFSKGKLITIAGKVQFKSRVESAIGFATKIARPIQTMLGYSANATNAAAAFDSGLNVEKISNTELFPEELSENDAKFKYKQIAAFDYPEYSVDSNELMQTLSDQYMADMENEKVEEKTINDLDIGGRARNAPFPGKGVYMKQYKPKTGWDFENPQAAPKDASDLTDRIYSTYFKKEEN